jgi:cobaltochelatase CobS
MPAHVPISFQTREELEQLLGPPGDYILSPGDGEALTEWAIRCGFPEAQVRGMGAVALANLYVASGSVATDDSGPNAAQRAAAEAVAAMLPLINARLSEGDARRIVREELDAVAPRQLIVTSPRGSVVVPGTVHYAAPGIIRKLARGHNVMQVGPAGCGKTMIGETAATALQLPVYITSVCNEPHELMGFINGYGYQTTAFRIAFQFGGVWIADEIDAWDAAALLVANSALANGFAQFPDCQEPIRRHADFRVCATANTYGMGADRVYVGRTELDAASLDRFAVVNVDYDLSLERMFAGSQDRWLERVWDVRRIVQEKKIRHVVSSRAIRMGAEALADGDEWDDVENCYLFKGMSSADRSKIDD